MSSQSVAPAPSKALPVWWPLRGWLGVEVLFGVGASLAIFLSPGGSLANFAWPVKPDVMAATLGAFYFASLFTLVPSLFIGVWQNVRVIVLPGAVFTSVLLLATILHWDRFSTTILPFYVWLASYVLPPPIFAVMYWWHQSRSRPVNSDIEQPLPAPIRAFLLINGFALTAFCSRRLCGSIGFAADGAVELHAADDPRLLRLFVTLVGLLQIGMAWEGDAFRARVAAPMLIAFPFALAIQLFRFSGEVAWSNLALWVFLIDVAATALVCVVVWMQAGGRGHTA